MLERFYLYGLSLRSSDLFKLLIRIFFSKFYFYKTQPVPNPFSFYMHKEPSGFHKFEVLVNHFVELIAPVFCIIPIRPIRIAGGLIQIIFQVKLIYFIIVKQIFLIIY
jgi:hypothetical protein